jgi:hypothetical protein
LTWSQQGQTKIGWKPIIFTSRLVGGRRTVETRTDDPSVVFLSGEAVDLMYVSSAVNAGSNPPSKAVSLLAITPAGGTILQRRVIAAASRYETGEGVRVKRVAGIAQGVYGLPQQDTYVRNVAWDLGEVLTSAGEWQFWVSGIPSEDGSYPARGLIVTWTPQNPFWRENGISLDLRAGGS